MDTYSLDDIRKVHAKAYTPWTKEEEIQLSEYFGDGLKVSTIAQKLERNTGAIRSRLQKMGLIEDTHQEASTKETKPKDKDKVEPLLLGKEQQEVFDILASGANVLLTGQAGTGKTYLLNRFIEYLKDKKIKVGLTASTGIAATHLNGQTIHSFAGFGIKERLSDRDLSALANDLNLLDRLTKTDVLIIDEISMLHDYQLDMVDQIAQAVRENPAPFGGIQVILCGDFYQLPPVSKMNNQSRFVTSSHVWSKMDIKICYLTEQYRQGDELLLALLNEIRCNEVSDRSYEALNRRLNFRFPAEVESTKLYTHNDAADNYNVFRLSKIESKEKIFLTKFGGDKKIVKTLIRDCLAPEELILKKGAVVMFVRNNIGKGYVNGTTGKIIDFDDEGFPIVEIFKTKKKITAEPEKWNVEDGEKIIAWISQVPLRLAWAITVHKSQGMTLDYLEADLSRAFTYSLGYVALSRARSLDSISLKGFNQLSLQVSEEAICIDRMLRQMV
ncbi:MAG: AAA family ATPase [bacterium]